MQSLSLEEGLHETRSFRGTRSPKSPRRHRNGHLNTNSTPWIVKLTSDKWIARITIGFFVVWSVYFISHMTSSSLSSSTASAITTRRFGAKPQHQNTPEDALEEQQLDARDQIQSQESVQVVDSVQIPLGNDNAQAFRSDVIFPEESNFIVIGDFGSGDQNQSQVADTLTQFINELHPAPPFILSTGDQIYEHGITSPQDDKLSTHFEQMYTTKELHVPWYISVGNHDCEGSIDAMLKYAERPDTLWHFPHRYYKVDHPVAPKTIIRLMVLDACDLVCGTEPRNKRCNGKMNTQTSVETRVEQYQWIENQLAAPKPPGVERMWKFVLSHWAIYSYAGNGVTEQLVQDLNPLLRKYHVHGYFSGHDHCLEHLREYDSEWPLNYFVSGAGGYKTHTLQPKAREHADLVHVSLQNGFASVYVNEDVYRVQFVDLFGQVLYTTEVHYAP